MKRLSNQEAIKLIKTQPLLELSQMATNIKKSLHPKNITTFVVDRNINYTNICWVDCKFCAFYRKINDKDAYVLNYEQIDEKIDELLKIGGTQILFQGGVHPKLKINWYEKLLKHISTKYPNITIHGFSSIEIDYIAKISRISYKEVLKRLKTNGLSSIPGAGAEILDDKVRDIIAPKKLGTKNWLEVHEIAHKLDIKSTATQMYGTIETDEQIVEHWDKIRQLQDKTMGFRAFIMWSFQRKNTALIKQFPNMQIQSSNRYLRLLSVARIYFDNIKNIQSSWVTQGSYIGQLALMFGANDLGSTMLEENVVSSAGTVNSMNQQQMIKLIKDVGEYPAKRNTAYNILQRF